MPLAERRLAQELRDVEPVARVVDAGDFGELELRVLLPVPVRRKREQAAEALVALPDALLGFLARGHVLVDAREPARAAVRIALDDAAAVAYPFPRAILGAHAVLEVVLRLASGNHVDVFAQGPFPLVLVRHRDQRVERRVRLASIAAEKLAPPFGEEHDPRGIDVDQDQVRAVQRGVEARDREVALGLRALLARDVAQRPAQQDDFALPAGERLEERVQPKRVAAGMHDAELDVAVGAAIECVAHQPAHAIAVLLVDVLDQRVQRRRAVGRVEAEQAITFFRPALRVRLRHVAPASERRDALRFRQMRLALAQAARALLDARLELRLLLRERAIELGHLRRCEVLRSLEQVTVLLRFLVRARDALEDAMPLRLRRRRVRVDTEARELPCEERMESMHVGHSAASSNNVTVIVWLCRSQYPPR